jgi:hypothetical protein
MVRRSAACFGGSIRGRHSTFSIVGQHPGLDSMFSVGLPRAERRFCRHDQHLRHVGAAKASIFGLKQLCDMIPH